MSKVNTIALTIAAFLLYSSHGPKADRPAAAQPAVVSKEEAFNIGNYQAAYKRCYRLKVAELWAASDIEPYCRDQWVNYEG